MLVWDEYCAAECPGCGGTVVVGILSLVATCRYDGLYYVSVSGPDWERGWYSSAAAFRHGAGKIQEAG